MIPLYNSLLIAGAYLVGALPVGPCIAWLKGITNLHERGSGNTGATNVGRVLGARYFALVLLFDALKAYGYLYLLYVLNVSENVLIISATSLLLGNCYSIFLRGRGGKGVATSLGIIGFITPSWLLIIVPSWLFALLIFRTVGIASCCAAVTLGICSLLYLFCNQNVALLGVFMGSLVLIRHTSNLVAYWNQYFFNAL